MVQSAGAVANRTQIQRIPLSVYRSPTYPSTSPHHRFRRSTCCYLPTRTLCDARYPHSVRCSIVLRACCAMRGTELVPPRSGGGAVCVGRSQALTIRRRGTASYSRTAHHIVERT
eukprot:1723737-Rhodomonas_salina.5